MSRYLIHGDVPGTFLVGPRRNFYARSEHVQSLPEAFELIARWEAERFAGPDWRLVGSEDCVVIQRLYVKGRPTWGPWEPARFRSWAAAARFLAHWRGVRS